MAGFGENFKRWVSWGSTAWTIIGWLGWKQLVASGLLAAVGAGTAVMQGIPVSLTVMAAFCVFVAAIYLFQLGAVSRAITEIRPQSRPDPDIWRHIPTLTLAHAACLLANVTPDGDLPKLNGDARGWLLALKSAISSGEIQSLGHDLNIPRHLSAGPDNGTLVSRDSVKRFAHKRGIQRSVFIDP